jgi:hypothetical protein
MMRKLHSKQCLFIPRTDKDCTEVNPQDVLGPFNLDMTMHEIRLLSRVHSYEYPNTPTLSG